jgi:hypothetical protein
VAETFFSVFEFDLGGRLEIIPNPDEYEKTSDLWLLYELSGQVFSLRGDGEYCHMSGETSPKDQMWQRLVISK